ncbi:hypothetical protein LZ32DRAFT_619774 [Colletotrichum eremochloae]|nr:hypothetical protein LZ32DRAFT_619774 [Colletotrichum eremochloae]
MAPRQNESCLSFFFHFELTGSYIHHTHAHQLCTSSILHAVGPRIDQSARKFSYNANAVSVAPSPADCEPDSPGVPGASRMGARCATRNPSPKEVTRTSQDEEAERARLQDVHNTFLSAFQNGKLKLPGLRKRTPIDFIVASSQGKVFADSGTATIHLLETQSDIGDDLTWLYQKAYLALQPGGWLMQLQRHHQRHHQPQANVMQTDLVKATLQNEGFCNLSLSVAYVSWKSSFMPVATTYELRVWVAQKPPKEIRMRDEF